MREVDPTLPERPRSESHALGGHQRWDAIWVSGGKALTSNAAAGILVGLGALLRVREYLAGRSLWLDEAFLALNLIDRPATRLLGQLDFNQAAPPGFLVIEDLTTSAAGFSEHAMRLFPLAAGIAALIAFAFLAKALLSPLPATIAVTLVALSDGLVYYSSELKPYSTDVAATCLVLLAAVRARERPTRKRVITLSLVGIGAMALSFAVFFVVAATAVVLLVDRQFNWRRRISVFLPTLLPWGVVLIGATFFAALNTVSLQGSFESGDFYIERPLELAWVRNFATNQFAAIGFPRAAGALIQWMAAILMCFGAASLLLRARAWLLLIVLPFLFTFSAAALHLYPLTLRTTLFLVPCALVLVSEGAAVCARWFGRRVGRPLAAVTTVAVVSLVIGGPADRAVSALIEPRTREELKPALEFVRDRWQPEDRLILHYAAQYAFRYYLDCGCVQVKGANDDEIWPIEATSGRSQFSAALRPLTPSLAVVGRFGRLELSDSDKAVLDRPGRAWFVFSHVSDPQERAFIEDQMRARLERVARPLAFIDTDGAAAYLYERG